MEKSAQSSKEDEFQYAFTLVPSSVATSTCESKRKSSSAPDGPLSKNFLCGVGSYRPEYLQIFASSKIFTVVYGLFTILQQAHFSYFFAIMSTVQKRYGLSGWTVGILMLADNISPIFTAFLIGHYAKKKSRPVLLFWCIVCNLISCFLEVLPYVLYGPGTHLLSANLDGSTHSLCPSVDRGDCSKNNENSLSSEGTVFACLFFAANFFAGITFTIQYVAGNTYVDDSTKRKNSPLHFACIQSFRLFGPSFGYLIASFCLRYYENPSYDPGIKNTDPRWVGAWWMGYVFLGAGLLLISVPIVLFPRHLPGFKPPQSDPEPEDDTSRTLRQKVAEDVYEFCRSTKRLFCNPIFTFRLMFWIFLMNGLMGYYVMFPKYIEYHYRTTASNASLLSGPIQILANMIGIFLGGLVLRKFRPRPVFVAGYSTFCDVLKIVGFLIVMFLGCKGVTLLGTTTYTQGLDLNNDCNNACACTSRRFEPVCSIDKSSVYFSPCFAGCTELTKTGENTVFTNCTCIVDKDHGNFVKSEATEGYCSETCENIVAFVLVTSILGFISQTSSVGDRIFSMRCIDTEDKTMALGVEEGICSIFAYIPYALIYGFIFDSSCLVWENQCGTRGSCWLYDADKLRSTYHGVTIGFFTAAVVFESVMTYYSTRIRNFYGEEEEDRVTQAELPDGHAVNNEQQEAFMS